MKIICKECGKEFEGKSRRNKICSDECRREIQKRKYIKYNLERGIKRDNTKTFCSVCGKEFVGRNKKVKICSDECREVRNRNHGKVSHKIKKKEAILAHFNSVEELILRVRRNSLFIDVVDIYRLVDLYDYIDSGRNNYNDTNKAIYYMYYKLNEWYEGKKNNINYE